MAPKIQVELSVIDKASKELSKVANEFNSFQSKVVKSFDSMKKMFAGGIITASVVSGFKNMISTGLAYGNTVTDMANRTGLTTKAVQELGYIAQMSNTSIESLQRSLKQMSVKAFEAYQGNEKAIAGFKALGVNIRDTSGNLKSTEQLFKELVLALADIPNVTERAARAQELFGKGASDVMGIAAKGKNEINALSKSFLDIGGALDIRTIKALGDARDAMERMETATKLASARLTVAYAPALELIATKLANIAVQGARAFNSMGRVLAGTSVERIRVENTIAEAEATGDVNRLLALKETKLSAIGFISQDIYKLNEKIGGNKFIERVYGGDLEKKKKQLRDVQEQLELINQSLSPKAAITTPVTGGGEGGKQKEHIDTWAETSAEMEKVRIDNERKQIEHRQKMNDEEDEALDKGIQNRWDRMKAESAAVSAQWKKDEDALREHVQEETRIKQQTVDASYAMGASLNRLGMMAVENSKMQAEQKKKVLVGMAIAEAAGAAVKGIGQVWDTNATGNVWGNVAASIAIGAEIIASCWAQIASIQSASFARGTNYAPGGRALVGEQGPELVNLPRGSQVMTNYETRQSFGGTTISPTIIINGNADARTVGQINNSLKSFAETFKNAKRYGYLDMKRLGVATA